MSFFNKDFQNRSGIKVDQVYTDYINDIPIENYLSGGNGDNITCTNIEVNNDATIKGSLICDGNITTTGTINSATLNLPILDSPILKGVVSFYDTTSNFTGTLECDNGNFNVISNISAYMECT